MGTLELSLERRIVADPTSLALLLAGPTGVDLWPGARRRGDLKGRLLVEADLDPTAFASPRMLVVRAGAPRRTPAAFVLTFGWESDTAGMQGADPGAATAEIAGSTGAVSGSATGAVSGSATRAVSGSATLALGYEGASETRAALRITLTDPAGSSIDPARAKLVDAMAEGFLDNLAAAAQARSHAA